METNKKEVYQYQDFKQDIKDLDNLCKMSVKQIKADYEKQKKELRKKHKGFAFFEVLKDVLIGLALFGCGVGFMAACVQNSKENNVQPIIQDVSNRVDVDMGEPIDITHPYIFNYGSTILTLSVYQGASIGTLQPNGVFDCQTYFNNNQSVLITNSDDYNDFVNGDTKAAIKLNSDNFVFGIAGTRCQYLYVYDPYKDMGVMTLDGGALSYGDFTNGSATNLTNGTTRYTINDVSIYDYHYFLENSITSYTSIVYETKPINVNNNGILYSKNIINIYIDNGTYQFLIGSNIFNKLARINPKEEFKSNFSMIQPYGNLIPKQRYSCLELECKTIHEYTNQGVLFEDFGDVQFCSSNTFKVTSSQNPITNSNLGLYKYYNPYAKTMDLYNPVISTNIWGSMSDLFVVVATAMTGLLTIQLLPGVCFMGILLSVLTLSFLIIILKMVKKM